MSAILEQLLEQTGIQTDTSITAEEIQNLSDAQLSKRLLPLGLRILANTSTEAEAVEGILLAEAGKRLAGSTTINANGSLNESPNYLPLNDLAKATILHALDRFVSEDGFLPEGCTHFDAFGGPPPEDKLLELIDMFEHFNGVALYSDNSDHQLEPSVEDQVEAIKADPNSVGAIVNETTGEVTPLYPNKHSSKQLLDLMTGGLTQETLDKTTDLFRQQLIAEGASPEQAAVDAAFINREISSLL